MTEQHKQGLGISMVSLLVGWFITFGSAVWYVSATDASTNSRLDFIEKELLSLDNRLDTSETFRAALMTDLAEIKTDLLWIRKSLEQNGR
jgi:septal ring factor EnvC (AmiA/AmiB activator)